MIQNILKINDSKTKLLVLTSSILKQHFNDLDISVGIVELLHQLVLVILV